MPSRIPIAYASSSENSQEEIKSNLAIWVFLFAFAIRLGIALANVGSLDADTDAYRRLSQTIHKSGTFGLIDSQNNPVASAYRPPLYPWLLSWFGGLESDSIPISLLHAFLGGVSVAMTFDIAKRLGMAQGPSLAAAALVLIDPILIRQSTLVMTETTATFLAIAIWWLTVVLGWFGPQALGRSLILGTFIGLTLGIACLCRPTAVAWCVLWGAVEGFRSPLRASCLLLGCLLVLVPWWKRNESQLGHGVWTTTHGGYTLLLANNPILYEHWKTSLSREWDEDRFHAWWRSEQSNRFNQDSSDEIALDRFANQLAWESIRESPAMFVKASLIREGWLWAWWPSKRQADWKVALVLGIYYAGVSIAAWIGLFKWLRRRSSQRVLWVPALTLALSLCCVHAVYWSNMRMRAPAIPVVCLLAAMGSSSFSKHPYWGARIQ
jgi:4-amino-4-deoxy-L-arabinose transferase-like glycosyltransferase